jgi:nicotinate-nucleotide pyrophosphorylase (carboxylating)
MRPGTAAAVAAAGLNPGVVEDLAERALAEDLGRGDLTSRATVPADAVATASYVARAAGTVAGLPVLAAVIETHLGENGAVELLVQDGARVAPGTALATVTGPSRGLLEVERTSLNLLTHLSGIATLTAAWVAAVDGTGARIRDTRKTTAGLRALEKYAVRCGGGTNHRAGLDDAVLIKDNHVLAAGGIGAAVDAVHRAYQDRPELVVQVEVDTLDQLDEALDHGADQVLLDNMGVELLREAVARTRARPGAVLLESSGGLTLDNARAVAETGVDFLAVGALTHSAPALDIGLDFAAD